MARGLSRELAKEKANKKNAKNSAKGNKETALTPAQRARRAALLAVTTCAAGLYVSYFATPIVADGSARSFERLTRSRDGFLSRTGTARAATMWALGDVGNARGALVANDVVGACVETVCRDGMDWRARLEASAFLATAAEDAERERDVVGAMRGREMRRAEAKIRALERGVREVSKAYDAGREAWTREREAARRAREEEVGHLRRALEVKSRELDTVRRLAKEVVCHYEDA